jgi:hypothetical protein
MCSVISYEPVMVIRHLLLLARYALHAGSLRQPEEYQDQGCVSLICLMGCKDAIGHSFWLGVKRDVAVEEIEFIVNDHHLMKQWLLTGG